MENTMKIDNFLSEAFVLELLGVEPEHLTYLRSQRKLPYVHLSQRARVYPEKELCEFLVSHIKNVS
jgi:hypothetical protein